MYCILLSEDLFYIEKQCRDPDEMQYLFRGFPNSIQRVERCICTYATRTVIITINDTSFELPVFWPSDK